MYGQGAAPVLVLSKKLFSALKKTNWKKSFFKPKGTNTKREQGKKVQIGNIQAAKVIFKRYLI